MSFKKCRVCKNKFAVELPKQIVCTPSCALAYNFTQQEKAKVQKEKAFRAETTRLKQTIKTKGEWIKEAQAAFNKYIRVRDAGQSCISCDKPISEIEGGQSWKIGGAWDAGHYVSVGANCSLRFEELNCHRQCKSDNAGAGKYAKKTATVDKEYRKRLIDKIGIEKVEWLEGPHPIVKLSIEDIKEIKAKYTKLAKQIELDQQQEINLTNTRYL